MPAKIRSAAIMGIDAVLVDVEADIAQGLPKFVVVGLPDAAVQESRERVRTAIKASGAPFPRTRITVNLAPADIRKEGPAYDLPMAAAILVADGSLPRDGMPSRLMVGELALDGAVRPVAGVLPAALLAVGRGFDEMIVPCGNAEEAALALTPDARTRIIPVSSLAEAVSHMRGDRVIGPLAPVSAFRAAASPGGAPDMAHIHGQHEAKRALEIAAAGGHNILMTGPPGSGKTLLARSLPSILPPMSRSESLEATKIHSVAGILDSRGAVVAVRPFRSPHHSASAAALIGGGTWPRPGEVSLAHRGVLFLDEFPEFPRTVLESLRQPLEDGTVTVSRSHCTVRFPAEFILVAARNPCPCGHYGDPGRQCDCPPSAMVRYDRRVSGPLLDRIDLHVSVPRVPAEDLMAPPPAEPSERVLARVVAARERQRARFREGPVRTNAEMPLGLIRRHCRTGGDASALLSEACSRLRLSARAYSRVLKTARTIADLDGAERVDRPHVAEALRYRERAG